MTPGNCATPNCLYCAEESAAEAFQDMIISAVCGDMFDPGDGPTTCIRAKGHEGSHTDGGDEWSEP